MTQRRLLLVGSYPGDLAKLPESLARESGNRWTAEAATMINDAVARLSEGGIDAAVCWAESPEELAAIVQLRKAEPGVPVFVLSRHPAPELVDRAKEAGAIPVPGPTSDLPAVAKSLQVVVSSLKLARDAMDQATAAHALAEDIQKIATTTRQLASESLSAVRNRPRTRFVPLVVEDDPDQAVLMARAFEKAGVVAPLPILGTGEEAIAYLRGAGLYRERARYPVPTALVIDLKLPGISGLEVLEWVRAQPAYVRTAVIILSGSTDPEHVNRAYQAGASSYLLKPTRFEALVELFHSLDLYWGRFNHGPGE